MKNNYYKIPDQYILERNPKYMHGTLFYIFKVPINKPL